MEPAGFKTPLAICRTFTGCGDVPSPQPLKLHWIARYLAFPYLCGGRDCKGIDCWGLLMLVYREQYGIELTDIPGIPMDKPLLLASAIAKERAKHWTEIPKPVDGVSVAMSQRNVLHHVGIYAAADGGKIIHCHSKGVVADTFRGLQLKGFLVFKFYLHNLWPT